MSCLTTSCIQQVPQDDLKHVFRHCDFPTRCKIQRVCQYWSHLTSLPDINEVVLVNRSCLRSPSVRHRSDLIAKRYDRGNQQISETSDIFCSGPITYPARLATPTGPKRRSILGPHVRVLIYSSAVPLNSDAGSASWPLKGPELQNAIYSIGFSCTNVQHIVLCYTDVIYVDDLNFTIPRPPSGLPSVSAVSLVESTWYRGVLYPPGIRGQKSSRPFLALKQVIHHQTITTEQGFPPRVCLKEEYAWVAKHAPRLPERFHVWASAGISLYRAQSTPKYFESVDLCEINSYTVKDHDLLLLLTLCILREKMPDVEPPPPSLSVQV